MGRLGNIFAIHLEDTALLITLNFDGLLECDYLYLVENKE